MGWGPPLGSDGVGELERADDWHAHTHLHILYSMCPSFHGAMFQTETSDMSYHMPTNTVPHSDADGCSLKHLHSSIRQNTHPKVWWIQSTDEFF